MLSLEYKTSSLWSSSPCFICHETRNLPGSCGTKYKYCIWGFFALSCYLNENCLWISETGPSKLLVTCLVHWALFLLIAKSYFQPLWCWRYLAAAVSGVPTIVSSKGCASNEVQSHLVHQSFLLSGACSGVSEMLCLSVELLTVTNAFLAEKAKYQ